MKYAFICSDTVYIGAGYIISYLKKDHQVKLMCESLNHPNIPYIISELKTYKPDVCLFSCLTAYYQWALKIAKEVKKNIGCKIIFGGMHVTACPEVVRDNDFIDDICVGDGVKYFGYDFNPNEVYPERRDFYKLLPRHYRVHPMILTSFDCPYDCTYCMQRKHKVILKRRDVDSCINECLEIKKLGAKRLFIADDSFTIDFNWLDNFLSKYSAFIKLPFRCVTHPKLINKDIVSCLKKAGCYTIGIGVQTANEQMRKEVLHRYESNSDILSACTEIKSAGLTLTIDHIFSLPGETESMNKESYEFYKKCKPDYINCYNLVYLPKTKIVDYARFNGYITAENVYYINQGIGNVKSSGINLRVAKVNPYAIKMLAIPIGKTFEVFPDYIIKLLCYLKIKKDFLPQVIVQNTIHQYIRRISKWLVLSFRRIIRKTI